MDNTKVKLDLEGRIAVVTGASRGIGYHIALQLAQRGAHIVAVARNTQGLEQLDDQLKANNQTATLVPMDLGDMQAIDRLGYEIAQRWGQLDILVANAAILGTISPLGHIEPDIFEDVFKINVISAWRLIRSCDPLLQKSDAGRAILMTSSVAYSARPYWGAYAASKAALDVIGRIWANENQHTALKVNMVNPGATRTDMRAQAVPGEDPMTLPSAEEVAAAIADLASPALKHSGCLYDVRKKSFLDYAPF